ncbi:type II toxin-antitoxin system VapB family antitoxin [Candidatus Symbiobacter mobilis]|nr:type II toxin-antitoxin system VapB family antitoxin [Candidatus Symbiobacter mobilis]
MHALVIEDELIEQAIRVSGVQDERQLVETALREFIAQRRKGEAAAPVDALAAVFGQLHWEGDLDAMRRDQ